MSDGKEEKFKGNLGQKKKKKKELSSRRVCLYFQLGCCKKGESCPLSHNPLHPPRGTFFLCHEFSGCEKLPGRCNYAHTIGELFQHFMTETCDFYSSYFLKVRDISKVVTKLSIFCPSCENSLTWHGYQLTNSREQNLGKGFVSPYPDLVKKYPGRLHFACVPCDRKRTVKVAIARILEF